MLEVVGHSLKLVENLTPEERAEVAGMDEVRRAEIVSIRRFVTSNAYRLVGRVLDFGAGKPGTCRSPQPYRALVGGEYHSYDVGDDWPVGKFDAILCTQVIHMLGPVKVLEQFFELLNVGGVLVMTYPTNWDEIESGDLWRYTQSGMERLLIDRGFKVEEHVMRARVKLPGFSFPLGHGVVAVKA